MGVTVRHDAEVSGQRLPVRLFLTVRSVRTVLAVTVLSGALAAWFGLVETPIPTAVSDGRATVPVWRMLTMGVAVLPVLALHSPLANLELVATRRFRAMQRLYLAGLGAGSAVIFLGSCAVVLRPEILGIMARSWIAWFGLALAGGAFLGWRLAWVLPSTVAIVLSYWGYAENQQYRWWEFSARPADDLPSLLLSVTLLATGLIAYAATPWRRRRWTSWRRWSKTRTPDAGSAIR
ncbi:hypothetical protein K7640_20315 [Micromonospora sp. PLK6-60]|uniref:hypothetical protein n=1 Tax=Micromonospora sp. PLK6-60 TaxID=2873383 RepID=UPI001CA64614|nr:hypothetical protein [Micromonospora sp. PLK6-60]MBY8874176.1 hypothetical protein [Micromonospora sp. PLK6-60]